MVKKWLYGIVLLSSCCIFSYTVSKANMIDTVPLLKYDYEQNALYYAEWNLFKNQLVVQQDELLQQEDGGKIYELEWNGKETLILPYTTGNDFFTDIDKEKFSSLRQKKHDNEILFNQWECWKGTNNSFILTDGLNQYTLQLDKNYELCGLLESDEDIILLLNSWVTGEPVLYYYDVIKGIGKVKAVSGFQTTMFSQILPEQAAIETNTGFYITNGFEVYFIDIKNADAELIFSKDALAKSLQSSNVILANQLFSCNISIGIYQDNLLVKLRHQELLLPSQWLYYCQGNQEYLLELQENGDTIYILPNRG